MTAQPRQGQHGQRVGLTLTAILLIPNVRSSSMTWRLTRSGTPSSGNARSRGSSRWSSASWRMNARCQRDLLLRIGDLREPVATLEALHQGTPRSWDARRRGLPHGRGLLRAPGRPPPRGAAYRRPATARRSRIHAQPQRTGRAVGKHRVDGVTLTRRSANAPLGRTVDASVTRRIQSSTLGSRPASSAAVTGSARRSRSRRPATCADAICL